ncbi:MAG TPA: metalloregulator ArsR/SmtB family transcription factor [Solirubrobacteraceae bacterium]|jgi:DNA-binding transcriptional ArsR family regulator|nr:metalloregulator ArsR/SmtB family transcription factor [Solirubrobacteraceae bacterium]
MEGDIDIAFAAALMADPSRAAVLVELIDGRALPPSELAEVAGVSRSTISEHLSKLHRAGFLAVEKGGRNRYFRLAGPEVATAVEALAALAPRQEVRSLRQASHAGALSAARTCYGHLAGRLGVSLTEAMVDKGLIEREDEIFLLSTTGRRRLLELGIERPPKAGKACNDWSERRPHLAGKLGVALTGRLFELGWLERTERAREVRITPGGRNGFGRELDLDVEAVASARARSTPSARAA